METLLEEKGRLAHENSIYSRENRFLREIVEFHQLTMQDVICVNEGIEEVCPIQLPPHLTQSSPRHLSPITSTSVTPNNSNHSSPRSPNESNCSPSRSPKFTDTPENFLTAGSNSPFSPSPRVGQGTQADSSPMFPKSDDSRLQDSQTPT